MTKEKESVTLNLAVDIDRLPAVIRTKSHVAALFGDEIDEVRLDFRRVLGFCLP